MTSTLSSDVLIRETHLLLKKVLFLLTSLPSISERVFEYRVQIIPVASLFLGGRSQTVFDRRFQRTDFVSMATSTGHPPKRTPRVKQTERTNRTETCPTPEELS